MVIGIYTKVFVFIRVRSEPHPAKNGENVKKNVNAPLLMNQMTVMKY